MRIDKFIWSVRLQKTRSQAAKFVEGGNVMINNVIAKKPSKEIKIDQVFALKTAPIWRTFKVIDIPKSRVGAKLVPDLITETTPESDLNMLLEIQKQNRENRLKWDAGRPTKKNRRDLDDFWDL